MDLKGKLKVSFIKIGEATTNTRFKDIDKNVDVFFIPQSLSVM